MTSQTHKQPSITIYYSYRKEPKFMLPKDPFFLLWFIFFMLCLKCTINEHIQGSNVRALQIVSLESLAYSSYTSIQIFNLLNWQVNDKIIQQINSNKDSTFVAAHNQFSYLSIEEIYHQYLTVQGNQLSKIKVQAPQQTVSSSYGLAVKAKVAVKPLQTVSTPNTSYNYDWRNKLSSSVKNQGVCGACWAFAAVADLESTYMLKYQFQIDFSQQQLIDCSNAYGNEGCGGGMMNNAYQYVINSGITLESYYPFQQTAGSCRYVSTSMPHFSISNSSIIYGNCNALVDVLKQRPVSVVISANPSFIFYKSGILNSCGSVINHALQLVGIIKNDVNSYYIGKNSWGTSWGLQGYVYIDSQIQSGNLCNVCAYPQYPS